MSTSGFPASLCGCSWIAIPAMPWLACGSAAADCPTPTEGDLLQAPDDRLYVYEDRGRIIGLARVEHDTLREAVIEHDFKQPLEDIFESMDPVPIGSGSACRAIRSMSSWIDSGI